jgi:hypothetical protein
MHDPETLKIDLQIANLTPLEHHPPSYAGTESKPIVR